MPLYVEWWPEHIVTDPRQMRLNQAWAEQMYRLLRNGGIIGTDYGLYVKRDGGLYRGPRPDQIAPVAPPPPKSST